jgi:WS/DGAT/MGAT family acyltransferase
VGSARRISLVPVSLARAKAVKNALGGTVNDVVLTAVGEALNHFLEHRGVPHEEQVYRVMVPVSVRDDSERMALGNRVTAMFVDLPVGSMPVRRRLNAVSAAMENLKEKKQAVAADMLVGLAGWAPATLHGLAGRLEYANQRVVNTVVSNVPGVQFPMYAGGARLLEAWPLLPLSANVALVICVTSYNGGLFFGLIGDYDVLPDLEVIGDGLRRGFDRLEVAALQASRGDAALESTSLEGRTGDSGNGHNGGRRARKVVQVVEGGAESTSERTPRRKAGSRSGSSPARRRQVSGETADG